SRFAAEIRGYVLCELNDGSMNAAISVAGVSGGVAATPEDTTALQRAGIPELLDLRGRDERWVYLNVDSAFNRRVICYQKEEKYCCLTDYAVFAGAWQFFEPINAPVTAALFARCELNAAVLGWGNDEHSTVARTSAQGLFLHAADWGVNLSVYSNLEAETRQRVFSDSVDSRPGVHTVCFVMTDGDNIQWILNDFATSEKWFGSPHRGQVPLGWTVSPALRELAPTVLRYLYEHAAPLPNADEFTAGVSGLGYVYPSRYPVSARAGYASLTAAFMRKADLRVVNVIDDVLDREALRLLLQQDQIDAVFFYPYADYAGLKGRIEWVEDKPVVAARFRLWGGFETTASLAAKLNRLPRDPDQPSGYSLVAVHVWSNTVDSVVACARKLDEHVRVVTPSQFVALVKAHLAPGSGVQQGRRRSRRPVRFGLLPAFPNPFNAAVRIRYRLPEPCRVELAIYDSTGRPVQTLVNRAESPGEHTVRWNATAFPSGVYLCRLRTPAGRDVQKLVVLR
ncbi:MAG TPA: T9SS type A sorting domain-containing protein, partial [Bacteroidetes bacterium]|nr:T9SS type A sorting domain-containing protein [Bacteroidota bacterium]